MADVEHQIEALEHQAMRAWMQGDGKALGKLVSRRFRMVLGSSRPVLLDRKSLLDAAGGRWRLERYRFGHVYCRKVGSLLLFAAEAELAGRLEHQPFEGAFWLSDLWEKGRVSRRWTLVERQLSRLEGDEPLLGGVKALQLWRS